MSDTPLRIALVGTAGLIGTKILEACVGREDVRLTAVAEREFKLPRGARMELFVAEPDKWGEVFEAFRPRALISMIETNPRQAVEDEDAFRAIDQHLVIETARAAIEHGVERFVHLGSAAADPMSREIYPKVKGEVERELKKMKIPRLDILRPGRVATTAAIANLLRFGERRKFRAIRAETVADAALALAMRAARGKFVHDHEAILRAARSLPKPIEAEG